MTDYKEHFLQHMQEIIKELRDTPDVDGLIEPLIKAMINLRDSVIIGPTLNKRGYVLNTWLRLDDVLDYHEPHYVKRGWFRGIRLNVGHWQSEALDKMIKENYPI